MITIIVPSYNSAHLISTTLDSIIQSTYQSYEVLIIDDESTDNTKVIVEPYLRDKRFNYIYQDNKGLAGARNTGIEHAKGQYLVFLDSDDVILPDKLQAQSEYLNTHPEIDLVYSNSQWFVEDDLNNTLPVKFPVYEGDVLPFLLYGNFIHVNSVMVRASKVKQLGGFDENFRELEDWDLWMRLAIQKSQFAHTPGILSKVRIRKGSMTSNQLLMNQAMVRVLEKNIPELISLGYSQNIMNKAWHAWFIYRIKAKQTTGFLWDLLKITVQHGFTFIPTAIKMTLKYLLSSFIKDNKTTKELEKLWNNTNTCQV